VFVATTGKTLMSDGAAESDQGRPCDHRYGATGKWWLVEQCFCLFQIARIEAFSEPSLDVNGERRQYGTHTMVLPIALLVQYVSAS